MNGFNFHLYEANNKEAQNFDLFISNYMNPNSQTYCNKILETPEYVKFKAYVVNLQNGEILRSNFYSIDKNNCL